jgi:hypothetical protein
MKTIDCVLVFLFATVSWSAAGQIGAKAQQGKIYGAWQNNEFGYQMTLMLNADGTGEFDGGTISFSAQGNTLSITQEGVKNTYTYLLQGSTLTLSGGDLDKPITFRKAGDHDNAQQNEKSTGLSASKQSTNTGLAGVWSGNGETIEFRNDGQVGYLGQTYPYDVSGNHITVKTQQGNLIMAYSIAGDQLHLTINNQTVTYAKGKGGPASDAAKPQRNIQANQIDPSMVGKWCYVKVTTTNSGGVSNDECFVLNADGTYQYHSERSMSVNTNTYSGGTASQNDDRGTWWVSGNRIYYNSPTQGQGSYQFEKRNHPKTGDPMIVLDGTTYVTFYNKSPW